MIKLHDLKPAAGSTKKPKRVAPERRQLLRRLQIRRAAI